MQASLISLLEQEEQRAASAATINFCSKGRSIQISNPLDESEELVAASSSFESEGGIRSGS